MIEFNLDHEHPFKGCSFAFCFYRKSISMCDKRTTQEDKTVTNGHMNNSGLLKIGFYPGFFLKYGIKKKKIGRKASKERAKTICFFCSKFFEMKCFCSSLKT